MKVIAQYNQHTKRWSIIGSGETESDARKQAFNYVHFTDDEGKQNDFEQLERELESGTCFDVEETDRKLHLLFNLPLIENGPDLILEKPSKENLVSILHVMQDDNNNPYSVHKWDDLDIDTVKSKIRHSY